MSNDNMPETAADPGADEAQVAQILRGAGPRPELPDALAQRWQQQFATELAIARSQRRHQWVRRSILAVAASALLLTVTAVFLANPRGTDPLGVAGPATAQVSAVLGDVMVTAAAQGGRPNAVVDAGGMLGLGDRVATGSAGGVRLQYRQADVRLAANSVLVLRPGSLELVAGQLYVDSGLDRGPGPPVVVSTRFGSLTHLGTQFLVHASPDALAVSVREGKVVLQREAATAARRLTVAANSGGAARLRLDARGQVERSRIKSHNGTWSWVADLAPSFAAADSSAAGLLAWAARQQGLKLRYADADARLYAQQTQLRGQVEGLGVTAGVAAVDALTDLSVHRSDDSLLVRLRTAG